MTPTCLYCDRRVFWVVNGEPRCLRHLFDAPPKTELLRLRLRKRKPSATAKETTAE